MRRKELNKLFETEYRVDPATGKEKRAARYVGPWYTLKKKPRRACALKGGIAWVLGVAAFITAGVIPTWAGLCSYVVPWYILCMLPLFYLALGIVKLMRLKGEFTQMDREESLGYVQTSGLGLAVLGGAWSLTTAIFLLLSRQEMTLPQELIFLACGLVTAAGGLLVHFAAKAVPVEAKEKEAVNATASETTGEEITS